VWIGRLTVTSNQFPIHTRPSDMLEGRVGDRSAGSEEGPLPRGVSTRPFFVLTDDIQCGALPRFVLLERNCVRRAAYTLRLK
jgi:hypothetical protein